MATENRDIIIAGGVLVLLGVLYFTVRPKPVIQAAPDSTSTTQTATNGPPSYNMPPILTLPPYNTGNAPVMTLPDSNAPTSNCGCNACSGKTSGPVSYANMTAFWNTPDTGITTPTLMQAPSLPNVSNTIQVAPSSGLTFEAWKAAEGYMPLTYYIGENNGAIDPSAVTHIAQDLANRVPGYDIMIKSSKKQYQVYQVLGGQLFNNASADLQAKATNIIFS